MIDVYRYGTISQEFYDSVKEVVFFSDCYDKRIELLRNKMKESFEIEFAPDCDLWFCLLFKKWEDATPDKEVQAECIAKAIVKRL
jgi:hypothetical protein